MRPLRTRLLGASAALVIALMLTTSSGSAPASAMSPAQNTVRGTMNTLYNDVNYFSYYVVASNGKSYASPGVGYANSSPWNFGYGCVLYDYQIANYCWGNIFINVPVNQSKLNRLGDYASGFWLAHEFGHHVAARVGWSFRTTRGRELFADCLAGVFTRYGYGTGRLNGWDYWEALNTLNDLPYPAEGGSNGYPLKRDRKAFYEYGYSSYSPNNCAWYTVNA